MEKLLKISQPIAIYCIMLLCIVKDILLLISKQNAALKKNDQTQSNNNIHLLSFLVTQWV